MQFHVFLLPVVVIPLVRWPRVGAIVAVLAFFIPIIGEYAINYCRTVWNSFVSPASLTCFARHKFWFGLFFSKGNIIEHNIIGTWTLFLLQSIFIRQFLRKQWRYNTDLDIRKKNRQVVIRCAHASVTLGERL